MKYSICSFALVPVLAVTVFCANSCSPALASNALGLTDSILRLGTTVPLSGPAAKDGNERQRAAEAIFGRVNANGGIHGRKIEFKILDNKADPVATRENVRTLIEDEKVFALFNIVGTPTVAAMLPLLKEHGVPLVGAINGSMLVRTPLIKTVFPVRPSMLDEVEAIAAEVVDTMKIQDVGLFFSEGIGTGARDAVRQALKKRGFELKWSTSHQRGSTEFAKSVDGFTRSKAKALFLFAPEYDAVGFMKALHAAGNYPQLAAANIVDAETALNKMGKDAEGMLIAGSYPYHRDTSFAIVTEYLADMKKAGFADNQLNSYNFEAYVNLALLIEGLKRTGRDLTREKLIATLEGMKSFSLGGIPLEISESNHQAIRSVYMMRIKDKKIVRLYKSQ